MSTILSAQSLSFATPFGPLLTDVSLTLKKGDRIGLIGHNGSGKSTFLQLLCGALTPGTGRVVRAQNSLLATIEQHLPATLNNVTVLDAVVEPLSASERITERWRAERLLASANFSPAIWQQPVNTLSGGQHTRLLLARALIRQPDILLLDEPGNHLDLPTLLWLESFLRTWRGSFILVSHDTSLLDNVTETTWILRDKTLHCFNLRCSAAREALVQRDKTDAERRQAEQREIDRVAKSANRLAAWGKIYDNEGLARKAKQMEKHVDRLKQDQTQLGEMAAWRLKLNGESLDANRVLALNAVSVRPADEAEPLFTLDNLQVKSGDRIALVGRNGCGKSSLQRLLWRSRQQQEPGVVWHPRVRVGYYDQGLQQLRDNDSLIEALNTFVPLPEDVRKMALIAAGFPYLRHQQKVASLSGGERSRLLFVGLSLARYSLLLLDEPTNHLDMAGKEELAATLCQFTGAVILVSHDRTLIEHSCNRFWLVENSSLTEWHDLVPVYERLAGGHAKSEEVAKDGLLSGGTEDTDDQDRLLIRLCELEQRLEQERQRKAKHQKPALQQQLAAELRAIMQQLGID